MIKAWFLDKKGRQFYTTFKNEAEMEQYTESVQKNGITRIAFEYMN